MRCARAAARLWCLRRALLCCGPAVAAHGAITCCALREARGGQQATALPPPAAPSGCLACSRHRCVLAGKSEAELFKLGECPLDPGGYFIVRVSVRTCEMGV